MIEDAWVAERIPAGFILHSPNFEWHITTVPCVGASKKNKVDKIDSMMQKVVAREQSRRACSKIDLFTVAELSTRQV